MVLSMEMLPSHSLAGDGSIKAICYLAKALKCIGNTAAEYWIKTDAVNSTEIWKFYVFEEKILFGLRKHSLKSQT